MLTVSLNDIKKTNWTHMTVFSKFLKFELNSSHCRWFPCSFITLILGHGPWKTPTRSYEFDYFSLRNELKVASDLKVASGQSFNKSIFRLNDIFLFRDVMTILLLLQFSANLCKILCVIEATFGHSWLLWWYYMTILGAKKLPKSQKPAKLLMKKTVLKSEE